jgi:hypothetical protein
MDACLARRGLTLIDHLADVEPVLEEIRQRAYIVISARAQVSGALSVRGAIMPFLV